MDELSIHLRCDNRARIAARYTFTMLGLIAGFRPCFPDDDTEADGPSIIHGPLKPGEQPAVHIPSAIPAWEFLQEKGRLAPEEILGMQRAGGTHLVLFPVAADMPSCEACTVCGDDIIAAAFFFLTLHEEWSTDARDAFGRFPLEESLLHRLGMLGRPVVAEYAMLLRDHLLRAGVHLADAARYAGASAAVCMTHDIDYLTKWTPGLLYNEAWNLLVRNRRGQPLEHRMQRFREYLGFLAASRNPYLRSFEHLLAREREAGIGSTIFVKTGGRDKRDAGYSVSGIHLQRLLHEAMEHGHEIGLHPSFRSWRDAAMTAEERSRLEALCGPVRSVRQHYLRLDHPTTWRNQAALGLTIDASLGFAGHEGFRNGTCHPFLVYDPDAGRPLPLWEFPLHAMDGTFTSYRELGPAEARQCMTALRETVVRFGGVWTVLFHNTMLDGHEFPGWREVFDAEVAWSHDAEVMASPMNRTLEAWIRSCGYTSSTDVQGKIL